MKNVSATPSQTYRTTDGSNQSESSQPGSAGFVGFIRAHAFQILALGILTFAVMASGKTGAMQAFRSIFKVIWPFVAAWFAIKWIKSLFASKIKNFQEQVMAAAAQRTGAGSTAVKDVIDLCPKCGSMDLSGHRCS